MARDIADQAAAAGEWLAVAVASNGEAYARRELYQSDAALRAAGRALRAAHRVGSQKEVSRALLNRAMIRVEVGQLAGARRDLDLAGTATATDGDGAPSDALDAEMAFATSIVLELAGQPREAQAVLERLLGSSACSTDLRTKVLNNLGMLLIETDPGRAVDLLDQAGEEAERVSGLAGAKAMHNKGQALAFAGRVPEALEAFDLAEAALRELRTPVIAEHYLGVADTFGRLRLLPEARAAVRIVLDDPSGDDAAVMRADALLAASQLALDDGDTHAALDSARRAVRLFVEQDRPVWAAEACLTLAAVAVELGDLGAAASEVAAAVATLEPLDVPRERAEAHLLAGRIAMRSGDTRAAVAHWTAPVMSSPLADPLTASRAAAEAALVLGDGRAALAAARRGLRIVDRRAALAAAPDLRHRLLAPRVELEQLQRVARSGRSPSRQIDAILGTRSPAPAGRAGPDGPGSDTLLWRELQRRLMSPDESPEELAFVQRDLQRVERRLRSTRWQRGDAGVTARVGGLAELRDQLEGRAAIAVVQVGEEAVAFTVSERRVRRHTLVPWAELVDDGGGLRRAVARLAARSGRGAPATLSGAKVLAAADALDVVVGPVVADLGAGPLLLVVDRGLEAVPWGALASLWGRSFSVVPLASPAAPPRPTPERPAARDTRAYLCAGPGLRHAQAEVGRLARVWRAGHGPASTVVQKRATVDRALKGIAGAEVAHLAAHAELRADNALMSPIHLADGPLTIGELVDRPRLPSTLYLSCCSLAGSTGDDPAALGAVAALLQGGVSTVVASTARLPDGDAAAIAVTVHTALAGGASAADGLRDARAGHDRATTPALAALAGLTAFTALA